ncbi:hypothetical protein K437DRAFT_256392 [Tilletiaria anomala UBC 951]|uniref:Uncharacterized protein n=1 Tax=Tilletiaria anomala (strain ATCC 24038 / CBS 436.72 / UBC 951) TaxID=1037660 RepID=A0A066VW87_TILAU|nr:uncharacterized protein K437DRAFT_256392 [Tilletiaria anomala UBC 951]KDN45977.1 hypothetical protein K437DRAFT_256392 [Tilletiaria anomala UBC 951]
MSMLALTRHRESSSSARPLSPPSRRLASLRCCSHKAFIVLLCTASLVWNYQLWLLARAWRLDSCCAPPASASASADAGGIRTLPLLLQLYACTGVLCAVLGIAGICAARPRWLLAYVVQQTSDAFLTVFYALVVTLLLYQPAAQRSVCALLSTHAYPPSSDGAYADAGSHAAAADTAESIAKPHAAAGTAAQQASTFASRAMLELEARLGHSPSLCTNTLVTRIIPTALGLLFIYSAIRAYIFIITYRYYRRLAFEAHLAAGEMRYDSDAGAYILLQEPDIYAQFYPTGSRPGTCDADADLEQERGGQFISRQGYASDSPSGSGHTEMQEHHIALLGTLRADTRTPVSDAGDEEDRKVRGTPHRRSLRA